MALRSRKSTATRVQREISVDEVLMTLPRDERVIMQRLRLLILDCLPKAREEVKYGVPFYSGKRIICFIWPPSIFSGPNRTLETQKAKGIALGFWQGNKMANDTGRLKAEGKLVAAMYFKSSDEIDDDEIRALLFEAGLIDDSFKKRSKSMKT